MENPLKARLYINKKSAMQEKERKAKRAEKVSAYIRGGNLSDCISGVSIMLSNLCNYACIHEKCPAHFIREKEIVSSKNVKAVIDELGDMGFDGRLSFHIYNEPMIDPRLFWFIEYAKKPSKM